MMSNKSDIIHLNSNYITKKIEASALKTVLASTYQTAYRLYLITNGIKEIQSFWSKTHPDYFILASVKTEAALVGDARKQAWNIKHLQPLLNKKARYTIKATVSCKKTNKYIYRLDFTSIKKESVYDHVQQVITDINQITENKES